MISESNNYYFEEENLKTGSPLTCLLTLHIFSMSAKHAPWFGNWREGIQTIGGPQLTRCGCKLTG